MTVVLRQDSEAWRDPNPGRHHSTFGELVEGREAEFPTLARAAKASQPAHNPKVEWMVGAEVWVNHTQITRHPYTAAVPEGSQAVGGSPDAAAALHKFLESVEHTLVNGIPRYESATLGGFPIRYCGGYLHYLGREIQEGDELILRPLREPFLWERRWAPDRPLDSDDGPPEWVALDTPEFEWLAEFSLQVTPAA